MFVVLSVASMVLEVVAVAYLWHPDTNRFLREGSQLRPLSASPERP